MVAVRILLCSVLSILIITPCYQSLPARQEKPEETKEDPPLNRNKRAVGILGLLGIVVTVGSTIQGTICTYTSWCGHDPLPAMLDDILDQLNEIESSISSLQSDVADIWQEDQRDWYFDQIEYVAHLYKEILKATKEHAEAGDKKSKTSQASKPTLLQTLQLQRFIDEALGENGKDKNVVEALFNIPRLVKEKGLIEHYLKSQKDKNPTNTREAIKKTWEFVRNIFKIQTDGYGLVLLAYAYKYKAETDEVDGIKIKIAECTTKEEKYNNFLKRNEGKTKSYNFDGIRTKFERYARNKPTCDKKRRQSVRLSKYADAYKNAVSEICSLWKSTTDATFQKHCLEQTNQPHLEDRRKPQRDYIFTIIELFQFPALQVEVKCETKETRGLAFAAMGDHSNEFWGFSYAEKQVRKIDKESREVTNYQLPDVCTNIQGGSYPCHPVDISVGGSTNADFRIAVATENQYLLVYKLQNGQLEEVCKKYLNDNNQIHTKGRATSVMVCGDYFGTVYVKGMIDFFNLDCSDVKNPVKTWNLYGKGLHDKVRCSNDGTKVLVESSGVVTRDDFFGTAAIDVEKTTETGNLDLTQTETVKSEADVVVVKNALPWKDNTDRFPHLAGLGFDSKGNFLISSSPIGSTNTGETGDTVGGIYQRLADGNLRIIREDPKDRYVKYGDLAVDETGLVYVEQELWKNEQGNIWEDKCIHKYDPELDFDTVKLDWTEKQ